MELNELKQSLEDRKLALEKKVAQYKEACPDNSIAAIEELMEGSNGPLVNLLHEEARLAELNEVLNKLA
jgi:exonuclease VII small subunit